MRLFLAAFLSAALLAIASIGGYAIVWQGHKIAVQSLAQEEQRCGPIKPLLEDIMKNRHLGFLSTSVDDKGNVYMYYLSNKTGDWMMLSVMPGGGRACVFLQGTDWQFIMPQQLSKPDL